ncbi:MAG: hypothetical protein SGARI_000540, partial [Bacillariaceae sp.]
MLFFRSVFLVVLLTNAAFVSSLKVNIDSGSTDIEANGPFPVTFDGLACSFSNGELVIEMNNQEIIYTIQETQPSFWYGQEVANEGFGGHAFIHVASDPVVSSICYLTGTIASSKADSKISFKTRANGSTWATIVTAEDLSKIVFGNPLESLGLMSTPSLLVGIPSIEGDGGFSVGTETDDGSVVDIMVVATAKALCQEAIGEDICDTSDSMNIAPILSYIEGQVDELNQILLNSQIDLTVNRVGPITVEGFTENLGSGNGQQSFFDLNAAMIQCEVGDLCDQRLKNCADIVMLIVSDNDTSEGGALGEVAAIGPDKTRWS